MPINKNGGKGCKKGKSVSKDDDTILMVECNKADGQMFGRVLKAVGDRRFVIFCNDSKQRTCKLAGSIRKNDRVETGGIVLISVRDLAFTTTGSLASGADVGDIISTVDSRLYSKLKKLDGINQLLFTAIENDGVTARVKEEDDLFDLEDGDGTEGEEGEDDDDDEQTEQTPLTKEAIAEIEKKKIKEQLEREKKRKTKYEEDVRLEDL
jgi:translation initiation factor IF-1